MINLHESMVPGRDRTRDPWICSQTRIVARHVTDACLTAEPTRCDKAYTGDNPHLMHQSFVSTAPLMHQSFVSTAPSPTGMGGDSDFSLFRVLWGQADGNNPTLSPALHYRKSHRG